MSDYENEIKKEYGEKVFRSANELLEKHEKAQRVEVNDDSIGLKKTYTKPVAEALLRQKKATKSKKYFFMKK